MNLVAKEYVAAQDADDPGVLILSRFAGAAVECDQALLVNPYDADSVVSAIARALHMPLVERRERHGAMLARLERNGGTVWSTRFLQSLGGTQMDAEPLLENSSAGALPPQVQARYARPWGRNVGCGNGLLQRSSVRICSVPAAQSCAGCATLLTDRVYSPDVTPPVGSVGSPGKGMPASLRPAGSHRLEAVILLVIAYAAPHPTEVTREEQRRPGRCTNGPPAGVGRPLSDH